VHWLYVTVYIAAVFSLHSFKSSYRNTRFVVYLDRAFDFWFIKNLCLEKHNLDNWFQFVCYTRCDMSAV